MDSENISGTIEADEIVWGAKAIGKIIGQNERQTFHRLEQGQIPCARKFGKSWAARKRALERLFGLEDAA